MIKNNTIVMPEKNIDLIKNRKINKIYWKNIYSHKTIYVVLKDISDKYFRLYLLYNLETNEYYLFLKQFENENNYIFTDKKECENFINISIKNNNLYDFVNTTKNLLLEKKHILYKTELFPLFFNPISNKLYTGLNYFIISNYCILNNIQNENIYYSNLNLIEHDIHILKKEKGIIIINKNNYELIIPKRYITNIKNKTIKYNFKFKENNEKNNFLYNELKYFFECILNRVEYIPKNPDKIAKYIINNLQEFITILEKIDNLLEVQYE